jgi:hypothetical protein
VLRIFLPCVLLCLTLLQGCGGDVEQPPGQDSCSVDSTRNCSCDDGESGLQSCDLDSGQFGPCGCPRAISPRKAPNHPLTKGSAPGLRSTT